MIKELMKEIRENRLRRLYLLHGEERWLVKLYENKLRQATVGEGLEAAMNEELLLGRVSTDDIEMVVQTMPFMAQRRFVCVRGSGFFAAGRKEDSDKISEFFGKIPESTVLVFVEDDVDKRIKTYKKALEHGLAVDFEKPSDEELVRWVVRQFKEEGKEIRPTFASSIVYYTAGDMYAISTEVAKIAAYSEEDYVRAEDIEAVSNKTSEARIFELVDAIMDKNPKAIHMIDDIDAHPLVILAMLHRQLRIVLMCADCSARGVPNIDTHLNIRRFQLSNALKQAKKTTPYALTTAMLKCAETDHAIKTGKLQDRLAIEMLILELGIKR